MHQVVPNRSPFSDIAIVELNIWERGANSAVPNFPDEPRASGRVSCASQIRTFAARATRATLRASAMFQKCCFAALLVVTACARTTDPPAPSNAPTPSKPAVTSERSESSPVMTNTKEIAPDAPLESGHVTFQGMVRPTKGGYDVRGVVMEDDALPKALMSARGADEKNSEWFLGAIVRITGQLQKHEAPPPSPDGVVMQMRSGTWFQLERLEVASVVKPAEMIEGTLNRSKGFFAVGGHLVTADDVAWSLGPQRPAEGEKVRFFGQSRTVVCEPNAQCLIGGSLPLFDVGRAERAH